MVTSKTKQKSTSKLPVKAYLVRMNTNKMVYFVSFETSLDTSEFITQWEHYTSSGNQSNIILQQSGSNGKYKYIAQYLCDANEFQFVISK